MPRIAFQDLPTLEHLGQTAQGRLSADTMGAVAQFAVRWTDGQAVLLGEDADVIVRQTSDHVEVYQPVVRWEGQSPVICGRLKRTLPDGARHSEIVAAVRQVRRLRRKAFRRCSQCRDMAAPEHIGSYGGQRLCHGCMESRGVVF